MRLTNPGCPIPPSFGGLGLFVPRWQNPDETEQSRVPHSAIFWRGGVFRMIDAPATCPDPLPTFKETLREENQTCGRWF